MKAHQIKANPLNSIEDALDVLESAAEKSSKEIKKMISSDYKNLQSTFREIKPEVQKGLKDVSHASVEWLNDVRDKTLKGTREAAHQLDESAKAHPWAYIGGAFASGAVLAFLLTRNHRS